MRERLEWHVAGIREKGKLDETKHLWLPFWFARTQSDVWFREYAPR
jgi:hypothetical protein